MFSFYFLPMILIFFFIFLTLKSTIKLVPQAQEWTVERFGRYLKTIRPGFNLIIPFVDRIGFRVSLRETVFDVPSQDVITKDNAMVRVDGVVFYQILNAPKAAYAVSSIADAIMYLTMTNIRTVMGAMDLDELLSNREQINTSLLHVIDDATSPWGIKVTRVEIKDITPPKDLVDAMARQMKAEREKRATILEAEGEKQAAILVAEGKKQSAVLEAEGAKTAAFLEAEARERAALAEANATKSVSEAIEQGSVQAVNYFVAMKYVDSLKEVGTSPSSKLVMLPLETSSLVSSLGGIAEITKQILKS